jgi:hypothetical protein
MADYELLKKVLAISGIFVPRKKHDSSYSHRIAQLLLAPRAVVG